jgi:hypothetical protein
MNTSDATSGQDPLAALEELLKKQQAKQQGGGLASSVDGEGSAEPTGPSPEELAAAEKEKQLAEYEVLKQQKEQDDARQLQEQIAALSQIQETPQEQARQQQHSDVVDKRADSASAQDGFEIKQIEHTKV